MIRLEKVSKTYGSGPAAVHALCEISLTIERGEFVAIMGASGSGKSTLMHILGLLDAPSSGDYLLCGKNVSQLSDDARAELRNRVMGFIFQKFYLLPKLTAKENVLLPLLYRGLAKNEDAAAEGLTQVGLSDRMTHRPNELSGGQQQRVAVARALAGDPLVLFADEPTGNLDSHSTEEIIALLKKLHADGRTIIMVTHEHDVAAHAERVLTMRDGVIIDDTRRGEKKTVNGAAVASVTLEGLEGGTMHQGRAEIRDHLRQAVSAIVSNKVRTFLSMLGVLIGVGAVIAMMALGAGANAAITERMASLGANVLSVRAGSFRLHGVALSADAITRFTLEDGAAIAKIPMVKAVSPRSSGSAQLVYGNNNWQTQVNGVTPPYAQIRSSVPNAGRFFSNKEVEERAKVAVIGTTVLRELFGNEYPIGKTIKMNRINFRVIGVIPSKGQGGFHDQDDVVLIPVTTAMYRLLGKDYVDGFEVDVVDPAYMDQVKDAITKVIIRRHRLQPNQYDSFSIRDMTEIKNALSSTTKTMGVLLSCVAIISLIVGGIGIMNIMLVSVTERTNEIGLRKAIGARRHDIMTQFLIEAIMLTTTGGIIGILLGCGISITLSLVAGWATKISLFSVGIAVFFSVFIGITFGLWPAYRAAELNPIDALRYE